MQGLFVWMNKNMRGRKGQQGFTLIELLVVVTILGILAGIVTLSLVGLTTNASVQSCNQEYKTVQAALDAYMADKNVDTVAAAADTNDMTTPIALYNTAPSPTNPNYTRNGKTQFSYSWDTHGRIFSIFKDNSGGAAPGGCQTT
ncbi:MAG TPA: prepilin-type N-terminal cleavage/methylation domain-containing protein [Candidatus Dormibacteraeota bacterium]